MDPRPRPFELISIPPDLEPQSSIEKLGVAMLSGPVLDEATVGQLHSEALKLFDLLEGKVAAAQGLEEPFRFKVKSLWMQTNYACQRRSDAEREQDIAAEKETRVTAADVLSSSVHHLVISDDLSLCSQELCWRGVGRFDARAAMEEKPWAAAVKKIDEMTRAVTTAVLGDDCRVLGAGVVMSRPGSEMQGPFSLSSHLLSSSLHGSLPGSA